MTRSHTVDALVARMVDVMENEDTNANMDEVVSAALTLGLRTVKASIKLGADREKLRQAVEILLMECTDDSHAN